MNQRTTLPFASIALAGCVAAAAMAGCYGASSVPSELTGGGGGGSAGRGGSGGSTADASDDAAVAASGLPCDVADALARSCWSCHGPTPYGAPMSLATRAELVAPSASDPSKSNAEVSVARIASANAPMPPASSAPMSAADRATFDDWVAAGAPAGACAPPDAGADGAGGSGGSGGADAGPIASGDLPCDVVQVFGAHCWQCHGATPTGGAQQSLVTRADLLSPSRTQPSKTNAALSVERMQSATTPMPPGGGVPAASVQIVADWIAAGTPTGQCGQGPDGGTVGDAGVVDPWAAAPGCASGTYYRRGNNEFMHPGVACVACHARSGEGPTGVIAGTAYASAHDYDNCNGISGAAFGNAYISVMNAGHVEVDQIPINATGNFVGNLPATNPWYVAIVANGSSRAMSQAVTSGDCNSCHTQSGANGAPGRILVP